MDRKRLEDAARQVYILSAELSDIERRVDKLRRSLFDLYKRINGELDKEPQNEVTQEDPDLRHNIRRYQKP